MLQCADHSCPPPSPSPCPFPLPCALRYTFSSPVPFPFFSCSLPLLIGGPFMYGPVAFVGDLWATQCGTLSQYARCRCLLWDVLLFQQTLHQHHKYICCKVCCETVVQSIRPAGPFLARCGKCDTNTPSDNLEVFVVSDSVPSHHQVLWQPRHQLAKLGIAVYFCLWFCSECLQTSEFCYAVME